jgi:signal transduction histidine kinase
MELTRLLLLDGVDEITAATADLMSLDPSFALWVACATRDQNNDPPRCVVELARRFAVHGARILQWPSNGDSVVPPSDRDVRPRWREMTADAMAVAALAADLAEDDSVAARSYLFGLLHNATDWLRSCGPRVSPTRHQNGCLPAWLIQLLVERSRGSRSEPVRLVIRAGALWREAGRRGTQVAGVDLSDVRLVRRRWRSAARNGESQRDPGSLPALMRKLLRLEELEQRFSQLLEQEKLAALGELAYGASHEINNPLANISARAQSMLRDETDPERRRTLAVINTQAFRANEMIADMMLFARPPQPVRKRINVVTIIDAVIGELSDEAQLQGTQLSRSRSSADELFLSVDATQMAVAIRAICLNAMESLSAGGKVEVDVANAVRLPGAAGLWAKISICDNGPGISREVRRHLFDPFFSGREAGRGMGLGLAKCWRVVTLHGGRISVASQEGQGATFSIFLPADELPANSEA